MCDFKNNKVGADELFFWCLACKRENIWVEEAGHFFLVFFHKYGCNWWVSSLLVTASLP